jgi:hypothetical protein
MAFIIIKVKDFIEINIEDAGACIIGNKSSSAMS